MSKRFTFDNMGGITKYVIHTVNGDKRTFLTAFNTIGECREWIRLKYNGARRTVPLPREITEMNVVEKWVCDFKRTAYSATRLYILITREKV